MRTVCVALVVVLVATGCSADLPPPASPPPTLPEGMMLPEGGQAGLGRVGLSSDVPARVERLARLEGVRQSGAVATLLCQETPCEVTLPYGDYDLRFTSVTDSGRTSTAVLGVHEPSVVLRHAIGQRRGSNVIGPVIMALGAATLIGAAIVAAAVQPPPANPSNGPSGGPPNGSNNPAPYIALGGVGALGLGLLVTALAPSTHQSGATTQWSAASVSGAPLGGSFVLRF